MSDSFSALLIEKTDGGFTRQVVQRQLSELPPGDVVIDVQFSSLNYKDGLSATGNPGVSRNFPHTPGIDAAGTVVGSQSGAFAAGAPVIVTGYDLGMNTPGGFAKRIRVPAEWVIPLPAGLSLHESMVLGTAGFTAALCVQKLEAAGMAPGNGPVLVTGATGGVGSVAVKLLAQLGYEVTGATGKAEQADFLTSLGASAVIDRETLREGGNRPMLKEQWGGVVDTVGGDILSNAIKSLRYSASVAACGLVNSPDIQATVLPFILRNVNLLGVDSVELPLAEKTAVWTRLGADWRMDGLTGLEEKLSLETLSDGIDRILAGKMVGRGVVHL